MRRTAPVIVLCLLQPFILLAQRRQKETPPSNGSDWVVKIVKAAQPESVTIHKPKPPGQIGAPDNRDERAPGNRRWLVLTVQLRAPANSDLAANQIKIIVDDSESAPVLGHWFEPNFVLFSEMPAGIAHREGACFFASLGGAVRVAPGEEPSEVSLLFSVPSSSKQLQLQIGAGPRTQVPLP
jgi:hypothetical protein